MKTMLLFSLLANINLFSSCDGQNSSQTANSIPDDQNSIPIHPGTAAGDTVSQLGKAIFIIFQDRNDIYWFGSNGQGVYRYDGKALIHFTSKQGLCNDSIREIKEDKHGNIFFTTLGGICKFDGQRFTTLPVEASNGEWKLGSDDLWFASNQDENGPYRYDGKSLYHLKFPKHYLEDEFYKGVPNPPYNPYQVYKIYKDSRGNVWFGTSTFGICRYDGRSLSWMYEKHLTHIGDNGSFGIRSIIEDKAGKFWFCNTRYRYNVLLDDSTDNGIHFIRYKREDGIANLRAPDGDSLIYYMSVIEDNKGDLWMATYRLGVWRYDGQDIARYPVKDGSGDINVYSIYKDNHEGLWLGTHEAGAYKFNGKAFEKFIP